MDTDILWKLVLIKVVNHFVNPLKNLGRVLVSQHLDYSFHSIAEGHVVINVSENTLSFKVAIFDFSQILQEYRHAVFIFDYYPAHVLEILDKSNSTDHIADFSY